VSHIEVRDAKLSDAPSLLSIYGPVVTGSATSFEVEPPTVAEFQERISTALRSWAWLVALCDGEVAGYAYGGAHRARAAYKWSVETSAYIHPDHRGRGLGTRLYRALLPRLASMGYCNAYAGITLPNEASVALHRSLGFAPVGVFRRVGFKFEGWHDVSWWHLVLRERPPNN
jgi:L-amino acid N-acyltransferase YncA